MGNLYQAVMLTNELKKQAMIKKLHDLGIRSLDDLTFYELKNLFKVIKQRV
jgi:hypothetical protein